MDGRAGPWPADADGVVVPRLGQTWMACGIWQNSVVIFASFLWLLYLCLEYKLTIVLIY